jgi:hypothetical protein
VQLIALLAALAACPPADAPGRVKCTADLKVEPGAKIAWADVVISSAPSFVVPLRGRMPPSDAIETRDDLWKFAFAIVAKQRGRGELVLRARAVVCTVSANHSGDACHPEEREIRTVVSVGE